MRFAAVGTIVMDAEELQKIMKSQRLGKRMASTDQLRSHCLADLTCLICDILWHVLSQTMLRASFMLCPVQTNLKVASWHQVDVLQGRTTEGQVMVQSARSARIAFQICSAAVS